MALIWIMVAVAAMAAPLVVAHYAGRGSIPTIPAAENLGEVGAAYGAAGAIISGFAFVAVVISMVGQKRQLLLQQSELREQKAELEEQKTLLTEQTRALTATSKAQAQAAGSLQGQLDHMARRARLEDYDRRLERFVSAQAALEDGVLDGALDPDLDHEEAQARLGERYLAALTNVMRELDRMKADPVTEMEAEDLRRELKTFLRREEFLLYLALVPRRVGKGYKPAERGRLWARFGLHPFVRLSRSAEGRAKVFRDHFWPLRGEGI